MRSIIDRNGMSWEVRETGVHGVGARAEGQPLPEAIFGTVVFKSADGRKVIKDPVSAVETMTDAELIRLLEKPTE